MFMVLNMMRLARGRDCSDWWKTRDVRDNLERDASVQSRERTKRESYRMCGELESRENIQTKTRE